VATSSKLKGNVIPGVAIATALMPPLCTAGYGLATLHWAFFFGAFYLFLINSVFIATATLLIVRILRLPHKRFPDVKDEIRARRIITAIIIVTLIPSVYLGYDIVQQDRFTKNANRFIDFEGTVSGDYLLNKKINPKKKSITLTYGGRAISEKEINTLKSKLEGYNLKGCSLEVKQGFAYLTVNKEDNQQLAQLSRALQEKDMELNILIQRLDSIQNRNETGKQLLSELKIQYPELRNLIIEASATELNDSLIQSKVFLSILNFKKPVTEKEKLKIESWLKVRLKEENMKVIFE
jgi:hypothetical protein